MGISLGLHLMPGVAKFAVDAGYRVPGTDIRLSDVVDYSRHSRLNEFGCRKMKVH